MATPPCPGLTPPREDGPSLGETSWGEGPPLSPGVGAMGKKKAAAEDAESWAPGKVVPGRPELFSNRFLEMAASLSAGNTVKTYLYSFALAALRVYFPSEQEEFQNIVARNDDPWEWYQSVCALGLSGDCPAGRLQLLGDSVRGFLLVLFPCPLPPQSW